MLGRVSGITIGEHVRIDERFYVPPGLCVTLGDRVHVKRDVRAGWELDHVANATLEIGAGSEVLAFSRLDCTGGIRIGRGVHVGRSCAIYTHRHAIERRDVPVLAAPIQMDPVMIGDDVMIYSDVVILPGVTVGDGAVVAVRAVVTSDVPPYTIVAGVPAVPIGTRT